MRFPNLQITLFILIVHGICSYYHDHTIVDNYIICYHILWLTFTALPNHIVLHATINNPIYNTNNHNDSADQLALPPPLYDISTTCLSCFLLTNTRLNMSRWLSKPPHQRATIIKAPTTNHSLFILVTIFNFVLCNTLASDAEKLTQYSQQHYYN